MNSYLLSGFNTLVVVVVVGVVVFVVVWSGQKWKTCKCCWIILVPLPLRSSHSMMHPSISVYLLSYLLLVTNQEGSFVWAAKWYRYTNCAKQAREEARWLLRVANLENNDNDTIVLWYYCPLYYHWPVKWSQQSNETSIMDDLRRRRRRRRRMRTRGREIKVEQVMSHSKLASYLALISASITSFHYQLTFAHFQK